jgi:hypothetical protein
MVGISRRCQELRFITRTSLNLQSSVKPAAEGTVNLTFADAETQLLSVKK